jgi:predicted dehydrogenase
MTSPSSDAAGLVLVGCGPMAVDYAKVLREFGITPVVVGRGAESAAKFREQTGLDVVTGGIDAWARGRRDAAGMRAIVAPGEKWVGTAARALMAAGVRRLLLEKPGGFDAADIRAVHEEARRSGAEAFVGYNRRFYAAVAAARSIIEADGGVTSFNFEFTEWSHVIAPLAKEEGVKEQWFLSNSTHVIDLAFHLGGAPAEWSAYAAGGLPWHPQASAFAGAGRSTSGALFSYQANWEAPGRWGLEVLTRASRLIFRPMEKLQVQKIGSVAVNPVEIDDSLDQKFKPGLYRQVEAFLDARAPGLPTLQEQIAMLPVYLRMRGDAAAA